MKIWKRKAGMESLEGNFIERHGREKEGREEKWNKNSCYGTGQVSKNEEECDSNERETVTNYMGQTH